MSTFNSIWSSFLYFS